ncbi:MAG TPA: hypothetical protein PLC04_00885 [Candidatus Kapabacteria bacterium]|nr:hypothetical protein [Candidatus Kapabacteria bacterium]
MGIKINNKNSMTLRILKESLVVLIMLSIFTTLQVNAQTYQPQEQKLFYGGDSVYLDTHPDFKQRNFVLGWHWGNGYKLSSALDINEIMIWGGGRYDYNGNKVNYINPNSPPQIAHNTYLVLNSPYIGFTWSENSMYRDRNGVHTNAPWSISHNIAYEYEPTYKVNVADPTEGGKWKPRQYDTTGYAFGFGTVRGYISNNQNDPNYDRLQLYPDSLSGEIVLAEPWVSTGLSSIAQRNPNTIDHEIIADTVVNIYNDPTPASWDTLSGAARLELLMKNTPTMRGEDWKGINFYLSINLRRLDANDTEMNNDTILEIRMPWVSMGTSNDTTRQRGYIKFDSIPAPNYTDTFNLPRGVMRKLYGFPIGSPKTDVIYITRAMLPRGNELKRDITISAFFVCDGDIRSTVLHNYGLKGYWGETFPFATYKETIDSLKIEVIYRGNSAIGIDKIKIETPASRKMWITGKQIFLNSRLNPIGMPYK